MSTHAPGERILGLEVRRACGSGGFGTVYEAWDPALKRAVAIKVLHSTSPAVLRRFRDEGRALARLSHPNIVQVHQVGETPSGQPALVMQFIPTGALSDHAPPARPFPVLRAANVAAQVLEALAAAHAAEICHRDVKAANVLFDPLSEHAWLCDFGIARLTDAAPTDPTAGLVGSRQSLAPERLRGVADDPRSDLFAAGSLLYRLLAGREPFDAPAGDLAALAERFTLPPSPLPPGIPPALARICLNLLALEPARRPPAREAAAAIRAAVMLAPTADFPSASGLAPLTPAQLAAQKAAAAARGRRRATILLVWIAAGLGFATWIVIERGRAGRAAVEAASAEAAQAASAEAAQAASAEAAQAAAAEAAQAAATPTPGPAPSSAPPRAASAAPAAATPTPGPAPSSAPPRAASAAPAADATRPSGAPARHDRTPRNHEALSHPWVEPTP